MKKLNKCLRRISPQDFNYCKNMILVFKDEKRMKYVRDLTERDYIPYTLFEKLYINPNNRKPNPNLSTEQKKET